MLITLILMLSLTRKMDRCLIFRQRVEILLFPFRKNHYDQRTIKDRLKVIQEILSLLAEFLKMEIISTSIQHHQDNFLIIICSFWIYQKENILFLESLIGCLLMPNRRLLPFTAILKRFSRSQNNRHILNFSIKFLKTRPKKIPIKKH